MINLLADERNRLLSFTQKGKPFKDTNSVKQTALWLDR